MKIKKYLKKKYFSKEYLNKFLLRLKYNYLGIVLFEKFSKEEKEIYRNRKCFNRLKKKYNKILEDIPNYKGTGKFSNIVWWCWLQGEENSFDLNKACIKSLRDNLKDRNIVVITEKNLYEYIDFPDYIKEKFKKGIISRTHFSDLIRTQLLIKYGGTWIDSSVYCTGYSNLSKSFFDQKLFVFSNFMRNEVSMCLSSWFITSEIENPILLATRDLLFDYWKKNNRLENYFLFHMFFTMATERFPEEWEDVHRFSNVPPHIFQFELTKKYDKKRFDEIKMMSDFHKLSQKADFTNCDGNTFYDHIITK